MPSHRRAVPPSLAAGVDGATSEWVTRLRACTQAMQLLEEWVNFIAAQFVPPSGGGEPVGPADRPHARVLADLLCLPDYVFGTGRRHPPPIEPRTQPSARAAVAPQHASPTTGGSDDLGRAPPAGSSTSAAFGGGMSPSRAGASPAQRVPAVGSAGLVIERMVVTPTATVVRTDPRARSYRRTQSERAPDVRRTASAPPMRRAPRAAARAALAAEPISFESWEQGESRRRHARVGARTPSPTAARTSAVSPARVNVVSGQMTPAITLAEYRRLAERSDGLVVRGQPDAAEPRAYSPALPRGKSTSPPDERRQRSYMLTTGGVERIVVSPQAAMNGLGSSRPPRATGVPKRWLQDSSKPAAAQHAAQPRARSASPGGRASSVSPGVRAISPITRAPSPPVAAVHQSGRDRTRAAVHRATPSAAGSALPPSSPLRARASVSPPPIRQGSGPPGPVLRFSSAQYGALEDVGTVELEVSPGADVGRAWSLARSHRPAAAAAVAAAAALRRESADAGAAQRSARLPCVVDVEDRGPDRAERPRVHRRSALPPRARADANVRTPSGRAALRVMAAPHRTACDG